MDMPYRRLGRSGLKVSTLSFGSWVTFGNQLDTGLAKECLAAWANLYRDIQFVKTISPNGGTQGAAWNQYDAVGKRLAASLQQAMPIERYGGPDHALRKLNVLRELGHSVHGRDDFLPDVVWNALREVFHGGLWNLAAASASATTRAVTDDWKATAPIDEDDDDAPRKKKKQTAGGTNTKLLIGGIAAALLVVGGIVAAIAMSGKDKDKDQAKADTTTQRTDTKQQEQPDTKPQQKQTQQPKDQTQPPKKSEPTSKAGPSLTPKSKEKDTEVLIQVDPKLPAPPKIQSKSSRKTRGVRGASRGSRRTRRG